MRTVGTSRRSAFPITLIAILLSALFCIGAGGRAHAQGAPAGDNIAGKPVPAYVDGELLVKFRADASDDHRRKLHARQGATLLQEFPSQRLHHVRSRKGQTVDDAIRAYEADPSVESAQPNYIYKANAIPNDTYIYQQWGMSTIHAPEAWDYSTGSDNVVIAVIDSGVDYNHPDLAANILRNPDGSVVGYNSVNMYDSGNPMDDYGHGTHVAGIIGAAGNNGKGVAGVAWNVKILPVKFLDSAGNGTSARAINCVNYVTNMKAAGVNIVAVNASWGGDSNDSALLFAITQLGDTLFIAGAGNNYYSSRWAQYPAAFDLPNIIGVPATNATDTIFVYSDYWSGGKTGAYNTQVAAPGEDILSTLPGGSYGYDSGTSMAAPHVAGLAALLKAQDSSRDGYRIRNLILAGADSVPALTDKLRDGLRINALGSLTCNDRRYFAVKSAPFRWGSGSYIISYTLSVISVNCGEPAGPVTVTTPEGSTFELTDVGGGVFAATWDNNMTAPPGRFYFSSPAGSGVARYPALAIATSGLSPASLHQSYADQLAAVNGPGPYAWSIVGGALPPGLSLDGQTGLVTGFPTVAGTYTVTVQVVDGESSKTSKNVSLLVADRSYVREWARSYSELTPGVAPDVAIGATDIAVDASGNSYAAGFANHITKDDNGNPYVYAQDFRLIKTGPSGAPGWAVSMADPANAVAVDGAGSVYVAGSVANVAGNSDLRLSKYSPDNGALVWNAIPVDYQGGNDVFRSVAVDGSGNVYATGHGQTAAGQDLLLFKFDATGRELWRRTYTGTGVETGVRVVATASGHVYLVSPSLEGRYLVFKYDGAGNLVWQALLGSGSTAGAGTGPSGLTVDAAGNLYVTGYQTSAGNGWLETVKFDANGNAAWTQTSNSDTYATVAAAPGGGVIISGDRIGPAPNYTSGLYPLTEYDADGNRIWQGKFGDGAVGSVHPIATLGNRIYATGETVNGYDLLSTGFLLHVSVDNVVPVDGFATLPYRQQLTATGGTLPQTWSVIDGALPPGLALNASTGAITGVPSATGVYSFTPMVTDNTGWMAYRPAISLSVYNPLDVLPYTVPPAMAGVPYRIPLVNRGGSGPFAWSITDGVLPAGLSLNPATGEISGTPATAGTSSFTVGIRDSGSLTGSRSYTLNVTERLTIAQTLPLPTWTMVNSPFAAEALASGGTPPYAWSLSTGALPPGIILNSNGATGYVNGAAAASGQYMFTLQATDANGFTAPLPGSVTVYDILRISSPPVLPAGMPGGSYNTTISPSGGLPPYGWTLASGTLPAGLTFANGVVSGLPEATGSSSFTVQVTDSLGNVATTAFSLSIVPVTADQGPVIETPDSVIKNPRGMVLDAAGNLYVTGAYDDSYTAFGLVKYDPAGNLLWQKTLSIGNYFSSSAITLDESGAIIVGGMSQQPGNGITTAKFDADGNLIWSRYSVALNGSVSSVAAGPGGVVATTGTNWNGSGTDVLTVRYDASGNSLGVLKYNGGGGGGNSPYVSFDAFGNLYSASYQSASRSLTTVKYDPSGGQSWLQNYKYGGGAVIPAVIAADAAGNVIVSGYPGTAFAFTTVKYDSAGTLLWADNFQAPGPPGAIATDAAGNVFVTGYAQYDTQDMVTAAYDAAGNRLWSAAFDAGSGRNEFGRAIRAMANGAITVAGSSTRSGAQTQYFTLSYSSHVVVSTTSLPDGAAGQSYTATLAATGGGAPYAWSLASGSLPAGISLDPVSGILSGVPLQAGGFAITVKVTDARSATHQRALSLTIAPPPPVTLSVSANPAGPTMAGARIDFAASGTGGIAPLEYRFRIRNGSGVEVASRSYGTDNAYTWDSAGLVPGNFTVEVSVRSAGSALDNESSTTLSCPLRTPVSGGYDFSFAIQQDGSLWGWGYNGVGTLGDGTTLDQLVPERIGPDFDWSIVEAGMQHTLAIRNDGTLWAWGKNANGQLGDGTLTNRNAPVLVSAEPVWASVAAGYAHSVAVRKDGTLWSWGANANGQLGDGSRADHPLPVRVGTDSDWAAVATGESHTLAIKTDGSLWGWGYNVVGQLGDGTQTLRTSPVRIGTDSDWVTITAIESHTFGIRANGTLWAWGSNGYGDLGTGATTPSYPTPTRIGTDNDWLSISPGYVHTLALKKDGSLWAWGFNGDGELGDGTFFYKTALTKIGTDTDWAYISAGNWFSLGVKRDGSLYSWGFNAFGELGDGTKINRTLPTRIGSVGGAGVPVTSVTLSAAPAGTHVSGTAVTFSAVATGGAAPLDYGFAVRDGAGTVVAVQPFGTAASFVWNSTGMPAGTYTAEVRAKSGMSSLDNGVTNTTTYTLQAPISGIVLSPSVPSPQQAGTSVTFTATASGGISPYQYRFIIRDSTGIIYVSTSYSASNSYVWTNGMQVGGYTVEVRARSNGSVLDNEASITTGYQMAPPPVTGVTISASPAGPQVAGTPVTFTAVAIGGVAPYQYRFRVRNSTGAQVAFADYPGGDTFVWATTGLPAGTYTAEVSARSNGSVQDNEAVKTASYALNASVGALSLSASPVGSGAPGATVTFTAAASGGISPYQYRFKVTNGAGTVVATRSYSATATFAWSTTGQPSGPYTAEVCAKSNGSILDNEAVQTLSYALAAPVTGVTITATPASSQYAGTIVTFTGTASGGVTPCQYRFKVKNSGGTLIATQAYGSANTFAWTTTGVAAGTYTAEVCARSNGSALDNEAVRTMSYTIKAAVSSVTLTASPSSPQIAGATVTFTGAAAGGTSPYQYRFRIRNSGGTVVANGSYGSTATYAWATTGLPAGIYTAEVCARSRGSLADNEAVRTLPYTLNAGVSSVSLSASPASPQIVGTTVTFTGAATGGTSPYQYRFRIRNSGGTIVSSANYGTSATFAWSTSSLAAGSYTAEVCARSNGSALDNEAVATAPYTLTGKVSSVSLAASPAGSQAPGTLVTYTATAIGGTGPIQYRFRIKNSGGTVLSTQAYGSANTYPWATSGLSSGTYTAEVSARSNGSALDNEAVGTMSYVLVVPVSSVTLTASPSSPQNKGTKITFTATATGGVSPYQYQFTIKNSKGTVVATRSYSTTNTYSWTTSSLSAGTYTVEADARSAGSTSPVEALKTMSFTLK
ncbi:MAG TPA: putative Ig domain-containing protein [Candidatus Deferrimicrobiaceae bacterium]|jgi:alpha-tubulin suppressor-like RCC1 family protein